jgi:hypothetical protein
MSTSGGGLYRAAMWGGAAFLALAGVAGAYQGQGALWSHESDGSWQAQAVSLGNSGSQVFVEYGSFLNSRLLLSSADANPPSPVWEDSQVGLNFYRVVDSASQGVVHASMHQELVQAGGSTRRAVLRKYSSNSDAPDWTYQFEPLIGNHPYSFVRVSDHGDKVVGAVYDSSQHGTLVSVFDAGSSVPIYSQLVPTSSGPSGFEVSGNAEVAVLRSNNYLLAVDLTTGETLLDEFFMWTSFYGGIDLSGDGNLLAISADTSVRLLQRGSTGFSELRSYPLTSTGYCPSLSISEDGSSLAFSANYFGAVSDFTLKVVDIAADVVLIDHSSSGSGDYLNRVSSVSCSGDGSRVAVGLWGDQHQTIPELQVFELGSNDPVWTYDLPGSATGLDFAPSGVELAVAMKSVHATQGGGGGAFHLFETRSQDFRLHGTPSVDATVTFSQQHEPEAIAVVLESPLLASEPRFFPGIGTLLLDQDSLTILPQISFTDEAGMALTPHYIANDPALIGSTVYYQGFGLRPRKLSEDIVRMTILP